MNNDPKPTFTPPDRLVNKSESAEILSVSVRTVERLAASGQLPRRKVRGCVRFKLHDVLRLVGIETLSPSKP